MNNIKVLKYFNRKSVFTNNLVRYAEIKVINEPVQVKTLSFKMDKIYDVPATEIHNPGSYIDPFNDSNYNYKRAFNTYRDKMGFMQPNEIIKLRKHYGISQRALAALLGISYATLSEIENNKMVQSVTQENLLEYLLHSQSIAQLISRRRQVIEYEKPRKVNARKLIMIKDKITK